MYRNLEEKIKMKLNKNNFRDLILFGKVLSAGLVVAGYAFLGVWLSNWLTQKGFNIFLSLIEMIFVTAFGLWQGWLFIQKWKK